MLVKLEGLGEPVMCIIDPIIAAVPDAEIVETIENNTRDIEFLSSLLPMMILS